MEKRTILRRTHQTDTDLEVELALGQSGYSKGSGRLIHKERDLDGNGDPIIRKYPPLSEVQALIQAAGGNTTWKPSVENFVDLPLSDTLGDVRLVREPFAAAYWWNGTAWEPLGMDGSAEPLLHPWTRVFPLGATPSGFSAEVACTATGIVLWRGTTGFLSSAEGSLAFVEMDLPEWAAPADGTNGIYPSDSVGSWTDTLGAVFSGCGVYVSLCTASAWATSGGQFRASFVAQVVGGLPNGGRWTLSGVQYPSFTYHRSTDPEPLPRVGGGGGSDHLVLAETGDPIPGALVDKIVDSSGNPLSVVEVGGVRKVQLPAGSTDRLVASDAADLSPATLQEKLYSQFGEPGLVLDGGARKLYLRAEDLGVVKTGADFDAALSAGRRIIFVETTFNYSGTLAGSVEAVVLGKEIQFTGSVTNSRTNPLNFLCDAKMNAGLTFTHSGPWLRFRNLGLSSAVTFNGNTILYERVKVGSLANVTGTATFTASAWDNTALPASGSGLVAWGAAGGPVARSIAAAASSGLSVTNADAVAGNPEISLALASDTTQGAVPARGTTADRVLAFTAGALQWLQVTANMLASNAVTNVKVSASAAIAWTKMAAIGVKGGLVTATGTAASNHSILSPGADGSVLVANAAAAAGLEWSADLSAYLRACTTQTTLNTDYTFLGTEVRGAGYAVDTSAAARTITISPDLFATGYELTICKWTTDGNAATLDAGAGNNIDGAQTYVLRQAKETITLVKDGADTWKIKSGHRSNVMTTAGDLIRGGTGGVATRLPAGTDGQVLKMVSGAPEWAAEGGGGGTTIRAFALSFGRYLNGWLSNTIQFPPGGGWNGSTDDGTLAPSISAGVPIACTLKAVTWKANTYGAGNATLSLNKNRSLTTIGTLSGVSHNFTGLSISIAAGDSLWFEISAPTSGGNCKGMQITAYFEG